MWSVTDPILMGRRWQMETLNKPPIWLLDVDGVINASNPGWHAAPHKGYAYANGREFKIRWAPALIRRIRDLHESGAVEIRWSTTWCDEADQLERLFKLPKLGRAFQIDDLYSVSEHKLAAAHEVIALGRRLIWTDDGVVPFYRHLFEAEIETGEALLIAPRESKGLQPDHLDAIEAFAKKGGN